MTQATSPSLNSYHDIFVFDETELKALVDSPTDSCVNVLLPGLKKMGEGFGLGIETRVDPTIKMAIATRQNTPSNSEDRAGRAIFRAESSCVPTDY